MAETAIRRLGLDQVWLMVSPGNPLKRDRTPLAERLASAREIARGRAIVATDIEARLGTVFTRDTLRRLRQAFPRVRFVWLTGADNFIELPRWRRWRELVRCVPVAVFPRGRASLILGRTMAGQVVPRARVAPARGFARIAPPAWLLVPMSEDKISSTALRRARRGGE